MVMIRKIKEINVLNIFLKKIAMMCLCLLPIVMPGELTAQAEKPELFIKIDVAKEVRQFKENKWITQTVSAENARRDDILVYTITYTNKGQSAATDAIIVDPIPTGTVYLLDSAQGKNAEITCSINGSLVFQKPPAKTTVLKSDGTREEIVAPANLYTHIKWTILKPVPPEASGQLSFKVVVQ